MPFTKCPNCGYNEVPEHKTHHAIMNTYVNKATGNIAIINSDKETIENVKGEGKDAVTTTWIRKDIADAAKATPAPQPKK